MIVKIWNMKVTMLKGLIFIEVAVVLIFIYSQIKVSKFKDSQTFDDGTIGETYNKEIFQSVSNDTDMFVYSAYFEYRANRIRVIGVSSLRENHTQIYCILRYNKKSSSTVRGKILIIPDHHYRKYKAVYVICQLDEHKPPAALTISKNKDGSSADNLLLVHMVPTTFATRPKFTVCLSPLHSNFQNSMQIIEWLEMTMLLGVDKVNVYIHNCSSDVMKRLQIYQSSGFIKIINWPLPKYLCKTNLLHYCGQIAALNDCLYRTKGYSKYISVMDIDELIIPQKQEDLTWSDILHRLPSENVYIFRNVFLIRNRTREKIEGHLITQASTLRQTFIYEARIRSKYIAKTDKVETLGIHFVWDKIPQFTVNTTLGLLHHYRSSVFRKNIKTVQHQVLNKYRHDLRNRVLFTT